LCSSTARCDPGAAPLLRGLIWEATVAMCCEVTVL
jgi:hypothetical protein